MSIKRKFHGGERTVEQLVGRRRNPLRSEGFGTEPPTAGPTSRLILCCRR
jgi:hypothetical protein